MPRLVPKRHYSGHLPSGEPWQDTRYGQTEAKAAERPHGDRTEPWNLLRVCVLEVRLDLTLCLIWSILFFFPADFLFDSILYTLFHEYYTDGQLTDE